MATTHEDFKEPEDWFWLIGYLAGKALRAARDGDMNKAKHHCISTAAVCANWHHRISGNELSFQPGHPPSAKRAEALAAAELRQEAEQKERP